MSISADLGMLDLGDRPLGPEERKKMSGSGRISSSRRRICAMEKIKQISIFLQNR